MKLFQKNLAHKLAQHCPSRHLFSSMPTTRGEPFRAAITRSGSFRAITTSPHVPSRRPRDCVTASNVFIPFKKTRDSSCNVNYCEFAFGIPYLGCVQLCWQSPLCPRRSNWSKIRDSACERMKKKTVSDRNVIPTLLSSFLSSE